jgi:hypothetical protein
MVVQEQVSVSQSARDMGKKLVDFVSQLKKAAADGVQLSDISVLASAAFADLLPAIAQADAAAKESKEDIVAFVSAIELSVADLVGVFFKQGA